ncbi:polyprenyl synthetase family protein [Georgenia yuyongxinii]
MTSSMLPLGDDDLEARLAPLMGDVEERLRASVVGADRLVDAPAAHLAAAGGKRLRPLLTLLTAELGRGANEDVLTAAVAVELTHLATLYHDDVMDSAPMRRGAAAAHEVWGNSVAILTGDLLFARASQLVARLGADAVRVHAETFERLCLGQLHETLGPDDGEEPTAHYIRVLADKTGSLIAASARYGATFSGAGAETAEILTRYGEKVGVAFQLADDVIDLSADAATTGKTPGTDLREGVDTMPVLLLRRRAAAGTLDADGHRLLERLGEDLGSDEALSAIVADLRGHEVVAEARDLAAAWARDAVDGSPRCPRVTSRTRLSRSPGCWWTAWPDPADRVVRPARPHARSLRRCRGQRAGQPPPCRAVTAQAHDRQSRQPRRGAHHADAGRQTLQPVPGGPRPPDHVVGVVQHVSQRPLPVAVPEHLPADPATHGPRHHLGHRADDGQVQPDHQVRPGQEQGPGAVVQPLRHPAVGGGEMLDVGEELWARRPPGAVEQRVDLYVLGGQHLAYAAGERGLARAGDARDDHPPRSGGQRIRRC